MVPNFGIAIVAGVCIILTNQVLAAPVDKNGKVPKDPQEKSSNLEAELKSQKSSKHEIEEPVPPKIDIADQEVLKEGLNAEDMLGIVNKLSVEDLLENVLRTVRDHPEILRELTEEEERKTGINIDDIPVDNFQTDFQKTPPQLLQMPKRVEKKTGKSYLEAREKANKWKLRYGDKSSEENYWKQKFGNSIPSNFESEEQIPRKSDEDSQSSEENYWKQKYGGQSSGSKSDESEASKSSSDSSSSSSSSESSSGEQDRVNKRVPEKLEKSIDLVSLPLEGGDDMNAGDKRSNSGKHRQLRKYTSWVPQYVFKDPDGKLSAIDDPFINTLPLFLPGELNNNKNGADFGKIDENNSGALKDMTYNTDPIVPDLKEQEYKPEAETPVKTLDQVKAIEKTVAEKKEKSQLDAENKTDEEDALKALSPRKKEN